jgi:hypothetical protein
MDQFFPGGGQLRFDIVEHNQGSLTAEIARINETFQSLIVKPIGVCYQ